MVLTHYGNTFERIGGREITFNRLDALDRLATNGNKYIEWVPADKLYIVRWKKLSKHRQKWVRVCSKSGQIIRSNCEGMTDASLDVRLQVLLEISLNSNPRG